MIFLFIMGAAILLAWGIAGAVSAIIGWIALRRSGL